MIQIDDTLVSLDVIERYFLCDLSKCKGECCVEGDSGSIRGFGVGEAPESIAHYLG